MFPTVKHRKIKLKNDRSDGDGNHRVPVRSTVTLRGLRGDIAERVRNRLPALRPMENAWWIKVQLDHK